MAGRPRTFDEEQVLERAMLLFWQKGFEGTAIADLEQATGLLRQSLYSAFGDKRALFERTLELYCERVLKPGLFEVLDAPGSARANLEQIFAQWEVAALSPDFNGCLVGNTSLQGRSLDRPMGELLRRKLRLIEEAFLRALRRCEAAGEIRPGLDLRATARTLLTLAQGLAVVARVQKDPAFVRGVVASARRLLS